LFGVKQKQGPSSSDYALRIANERLREENLQLQEQVNEYERWMGYIMTKFRLQNVSLFSFHLLEALLSSFVVVGKG
jgi:hypothetical protein